MRLIFWTGFWTFLIDQISKYGVVHGLGLISKHEIDVIPPFFNLRMAWNEGVNFGLGAGSSPLLKWGLIAVAIIISVVVLWWMAQEKPGTKGYIAAGLLIGGALGNVVDRVVYGAVADFINTSCCGIENPFAFNVADIAIFIGAIGLILFTGKKKGA